MVIYEQDQFAHAVRKLENRHVRMNEFRTDDFVQSNLKSGRTTRTDDPPCLSEGDAISRKKSTKCNTALSDATVFAPLHPVGKVLVGITSPIERKEHVMRFFVESVSLQHF